MGSYKIQSRPLLNSKTVFFITLLVLALTIVGVYAFGLGRHHTFFQNSLLSTTLLSIAFFGFVSIGLYRGVKLRDTLGNVADRFSLRRGKGEDRSSLLNLADALPSFSKGGSSGSSGSSFDFDFDDGEGCLAVLVGILLWIVTAVVLSVVLWLFGEVLVVAVGMFMAMLYWVFFRALRLVFRHSRQTKGRLVPSLGYGLLYTFLYNSWIYGIFVLVEYLRG